MQLALSTKVVREGIFLRPGILKVTNGLYVSFRFIR